MLGKYDARVIWVAHGSQPSLETGGFPIWLRTTFRLGTRRAASTTDPNCASVIGIASKTTRSGEQPQRFQNLRPQNPFGIRLIRN